MTPDDKAALREWRDTATNQEDKKLLRKALNHIHSLEQRLLTVRTLLRTALNESGTAHDGREQPQETNNVR